MEKRSVLLLVSFILMLGVVSAQEIVLDIKTDKPAYSAGDNVTYTVLLLSDNLPLSSDVVITFSDALGRKSLNKTVLSNVENTLPIEKDFSSGFWSMEARYGEKSVRRIFSIGEREDVEFSINGDKLIIKNNGNVPYTRTVQILIGEKIITQKQNIRVGEFKEIRLLAPQGSYTIQITDGVNTLTKSNVMLVGTGNVIGALDEDLVKSSKAPLSSSGNPTDENSFTFTSRFSVAFIFIGAVGALALLIFIERTTRKKAHSKMKDRLSTIKEHA